jgi:hypothetical protein
VQSPLSSHYSFSLSSFGSFRDIPQIQAKSENGILAEVLINESGRTKRSDATRNLTLLAPDNLADLIEHPGQVYLRASALLSETPGRTSVRSCFGEAWNFRNTDVSYTTRTAATTVGTGNFQLKSFIDLELLTISCRIPRCLQSSRTFKSRRWFMEPKATWAWCYSPRD